MGVLHVFQATFCEFLERRHGAEVLQAVRQRCSIDSADRSDVAINMGM